MYHPSDPTILAAAGEAAAGKSQLALQSLLTVQLPLDEGGLGGRAVYIYTEGKPPVERLQSIHSNRFKGRADVSLVNVLIEERPIGSPDDLLRSVRQLAAMLEREAAAASSGSTAAAMTRKIRLVVIDSVAHVFRDMADGDTPQVQHLHRRASQLFGLSALLKRMAQQHQLAVLLTNQIMDDVLHDDKNSAIEKAGLPSTIRGAVGGGSKAAPLVSSGRRVLPALGLAWANCVNCRLFAARHETWAGGVIRSLQVVFAPHLPHSYCCFRVEPDGVCGVDEEGECASASASAGASGPGVGRIGSGGGPATLAVQMGNQQVPG